MYVNTDIILILVQTVSFQKHKTSSKTMNTVRNSISIKESCIPNHPHLLLAVSQAAVISLIKTIEDWNTQFIFFFRTSITDTGSEIKNNGYEVAPHFQ